MWATAPVTYTLTLSSGLKFAGSPSICTYEKVTWTAVGEAAAGSVSGESAYNGQQFGTGASKSTATITTSGISGTISSVKVTSQSGSGNSATPKVSVSVGGVAYGTQNMKIASAATGSAPTELTFNGSGSGEISITLDQNNGNKALYLHQIVVIYTPVVETKVATPTISLEEGLYYGTKSVTLETTTTDADIYYTTNGTTPTSGSTKYTGAISVSTSQTIKAIGIKDGLEDSEVASAKYTIINSVPTRTPKAYNTNYFVKVTNIDDLEDGDAVLIINQDGNKAMADQNASHYRNEVAVSSNGGVITTIPAKAQKFVLIKAENRFFFSTDENSYIYASTSGNSNYLDTDNEATAGANALASVEIAANGNASIIFLGDNTKNDLRYNSGSTRFTCYASSSLLPTAHLYKEQAIAGPSNPVVEGSTVTLTTTANMAGWRTYNNNTSKKYSVDGNTKVYYASATGDNKVTLTEIDGGVPANTAVILHNSASTTITLTETDADITAPVSNKLQVSTLGQDLGKVYRLGYKSGTGVGFYTYTTSDAPAGIIYVSSVSSANFLSFDFGDVTGIESLTPDPSPKGEGSEYFNLAGQRVAQPTKGLYIVNGKKVVIK